MAEQLNSFQIQLLLYFPETDPKKRTVTDAAKCLGKTKVAITRALDKLEEKNIVERVEGRKTVLTSYGERLAQENAMTMLLAGFTDEFLERMEEQEERMRIKEFFAGRKRFMGFDSTAAVVNIPTQLDGHPVTAIGISQNWGAKGAFENNTSMQKLVVPSSVTRIEAKAFKNCSGLQQVLINSSVTEIGNEAFASCSALQIVQFGGSGLFSIGDSAFANCTALDKVLLPDTVTSIGKRAYAKCTAMTSITIPDSVTDLGGAAFAGCTALEEAVIGNGVTELTTDGSDFGGADNWKDGCFEHCTSLAKVTMGTSVKTIDVDAFSECTALKEIVIPDNVETIGAGAFEYCDDMKTAVIGNGVVTIGKDAFCGTALVNVTIPDNVVTVDSGAFLDCKSLTTVHIGDGVVTMGDEVFKNDESLTDVHVGNGVVKIGKQTWKNCTSLESLLIPSNVTELGGGLCAGDTALKRVVIGNGVTDLTGNGDDYRGSDGWCDGAFEACTSLSDISIGSGMINIGKDTFADTALKSVLIPSKVSSLDSGVFYNCGLEKLYFTGTAPSFAKNLFGDSEAPSMYKLDGKSGYDSLEYSFSNFTPVKVTFDLNSDVFVITPSDQYMTQEGGYVIEPLEPMEEDYLFLGWYHDKECTQKWDFLKDRVNADTTIYAK